MDQSQGTLHGGSHCSNAGWNGRESRNARSATTWCFEIFGMWLRITSRWRFGETILGSLRLSEWWCCCQHPQFSSPGSTWHWSSLLASWPSWGWGPHRNHLESNKQSNGDNAQHSFIQTTEYKIITVAAFGDWIRTSLERGGNTLSRLANDHRESECCHSIWCGRATFSVHWIQRGSSMVQIYFQTWFLLDWSQCVFSVPRNFTTNWSELCFGKITRVAGNPPFVRLLNSSNKSSQNRIATQRLLGTFWPNCFFPLNHY